MGGENLESGLLVEVENGEDLARGGKMCSLLTAHCCCCCCFSENQGVDGVKHDEVRAQAIE